MRDIENYEMKYLKVDFELEYLVKYRRKKVLELLSMHEHKHILEVGCGMDSLANYVEEYESFTIVEPGEHFINENKNKLKNPEKTRFVKGFIEEQIANLQDRKYDFIVISGLLHEIENPEELLLGIAQLCEKDKTIVHINVPNANSLHRILAYESGLIPKLNAYSAANIEFEQHNIFSMEVLEKMISTSVPEGESVEIVEKGSYFIKPFSHKQMQDCLDKEIISDKVIDGFDRLSKYLPDYGAEIFVNYKVV